MSRRGGTRFLAIASGSGDSLTASAETRHLSESAHGERLAVRLGRSLKVIGSLWLLLLLYSFLRIPIPGVNEPHYLTKAKAYWNPEWCAGDLFLESSNPHRAFYLTIGWLTQFLTLQETAIVGRFIALAVVAWGWAHLCASFGFGLARSAAALCLLLLLQTLGSWSGEWLVGGVESKVFAYGLAFAGLGALFSGRTTSAGIWLGLSTTMHPLVGAWTMVAAVISGFWTRYISKNEIMEASNPERPRQLLTMSLWWFVAAAPGIGWVLPAVLSGDPAQARDADYIQVGYRLSHHLDPWTFPRESHRFFACLVTLWLVLRWSTPSNSRLRRFDGVVAVSVVIGLLATFLSYGPRPWQLPLSPLAALQIKMLKFYPFRGADLMTASVLAVRGVLFWSTHANWRPVWSFAATLAVSMTAIVVPGLDQNPSRMPPSRQRDWREALRWIRANTPKDSLLIAPNEDVAVKWFAERPEYVNYKDCPQDARSLVEWNRRLGTFAQWSRDSFANDQRYSAEELSQLHQQTGIDLLIVSRLGPFATEPLFANGSFRVFRTTTDP